MDFKIVSAIALLIAVAGPIRAKSAPTSTAWTSKNDTDDNSTVFELELKEEENMTNTLILEADDGSVHSRNGKAEEKRVPTPVRRRPVIQIGSKREDSSPTDDETIASSSPLAENQKTRESPTTASAINSSRPPTVSCVEKAEGNVSAAQLRSRLHLQIASNKTKRWDDAFMRQLCLFIYKAFANSANKSRSSFQIVFVRNAATRQISFFVLDEEGTPFPPEEVKKAMEEALEEWKYEKLFVRLMGRGETTLVSVSVLKSVLVAVLSVVLSVLLVSILVLCVCQRYQHRHHGVWIVNDRRHKDQQTDAWSFDNRAYMDEKNVETHNGLSR